MNLTDQEIVARTRSNTERFYELANQLKERGNNIAANDVAAKVQQAMAYSWGWQDKAGVNDSDESLAFGYAYGIHCCEFELEMRCHRRNVADAFRRWTKTGDINGDA